MSLVYGLVLSIAVTIVVTILSIAIEKRAGILCIDIHKPHKPLVPCIGGFAILAGTLVGLVVTEPYSATTLGATMSILIAFALGLLDDIRGLSAYSKVLAGFLPAIPILMLKLYTPHPWLPFLGYTRMTLVYPILVLAAFTVYINGANMIDTHNGVLIAATLIAHLGGLVLAIASGMDWKCIALLLIFIAVLASYLPFNIYPAKIFNGNAGSFTVGCMLALSSILARLEIYFVLACMPLFVNGFYYLSSVKKLLQKERVERPIDIDSRGCMRAKLSRKAPITLVRLVLAFAKSPLSELELISILIPLYATTTVIATLLLYILGYGQ